MGMPAGTEHPVDAYTAGHSFFIDEIYDVPFIGSINAALSNRITGRTAFFFRAEAFHVGFQLAF